MMNEPTQVDHSACAANGCNMLGTNSRSTTGGNDWFCFVHFGSQAKDWQLVTNELNRLQWLVDIVKRLRGGQPLTLKQNQAFVLAQRSDLKQKDSEGGRAWMMRLEGVLSQSCKDSLVQP